MPCCWTVANGIGPLEGRRVPAAIPANLKYQPVGVPKTSGGRQRPVAGGTARVSVPAWLRGESLQLEVGGAIAKASCSSTAIASMVPPAAASRIATTSPSCSSSTARTSWSCFSAATSRDEGGLRHHYNPDAWIENDAHRDYPPSNENFACALADVWLRALPASPSHRHWSSRTSPRIELLVFSRVQNVRNTPCPSSFATRLPRKVPWLPA